MAVAERNHWVLLISTAPVPSNTDVTQWRSDEIVEKIHVLVSSRDGNLIVPPCRTGVVQDIVKSTMEMYPMVECLLRETQRPDSNVRTGGAYVSKSSYDTIVDLVTAAVTKSKKAYATPVDTSMVYPIHVKHDISFPQQLMDFNRYMREACPNNDFAQHVYRNNKVQWLTLPEIRVLFPDQAPVLERVLRSYQYQAS